MNKTLISLFAICTFCFQSLTAQRSGGFEPQLRVSYDKGVSKMKPNTVSVEFIAGLRTSEQTRVGLGIGYSSHSHLIPSEPGIGYGSSWDTTYKTVSSIPIFLTAKHNFNVKKFSPYVGLDVGFNHYPSAGGNDSSAEGFYLRPHGGVDLLLGRSRISLEASFRHSTIFNHADIDGWFSQVGISAGFSLEL